MYSLRRTLALRLSATVLVALVGIAMLAVWGMRRTLEHQLDGALTSASRLEQAAVLALGALPAHPGIHGPDEFVARVNRFVAVRDAGGRVVDANAEWARTLPLDRAALGRARDGEPVWTTGRWEGHALRSRYERLPGSGDRVLQVAASLAPLESASRRVFLVLLGVAVLSALITYVGASWFARSALSPIAEICTIAERFAPGSEGLRITAHADVSEFHRLVRVLNHMLERLERAAVTQRRMIADVAHDLRTPITAMRGEVEIALRHDRSAEEYRRLLGSLSEEVDRLAGIGDSLLALARLEAGQSSLRRQPTDLEEVLAEAVARFRERHEDHRFELEGSAGGDAVAPVDRQLIALVLDHLLDNAARHTPPGTRVRASVRADSASVRIAVEDDGPGLPPEDLEHAEEGFYRGDPARGRGAGAGLGLTLAAAVMRAHGGELALQPSIRSGLLAVLRVPRQPLPSRSAA